MFLANENFPRPGIILLRQQNIEVVSIQELMPGISDDLVLAKAIKENLIILTYDSDYGELIFKYAKKNPPSVIYFREKGNTADFAAQTLLKCLSEKRLTFANAFTVIEKDNIRQRFYSKQ